MDINNLCLSMHGIRARLLSVFLLVSLQLCAVEPVFATDVVQGPNDLVLTPGVIDEGEYGYGWGSNVHPGELVAWFESTGIDLVFHVTGYDIDSDTEVKVLLNGQQVGYLSKGGDRTLNNGNKFPFAGSEQLPGLNEIRFVTIKPGRVWGITDLLLSTEANHPPMISLLSPVSDAVISPGSNVLLEASAIDDDGSIVKVEFFAGTQKLGEAVTAPYSFVWTNVPAGMHSITATAKDDQMASAVSDAVSISVCVDVDGNQVCDVQTSASVIDTALASMTPNTWRKINLNQYQDVWTPSNLRPNTTSPSQNISGWSGAAWDSLRDKFYIWGGNIGMEEGNEVYGFNAQNGMWERGSLPSGIPSGYGVSDRPYVNGGIFDAPLSGESWDNVVYLENMDRLAIIGISRNSNPWRDSEGNTTGPYFWDPSKADANKVGGSNGTGVDPTTLGGNMWENRDNQGTFRHLQGAAINVSNFGVDVVLFSDTRANLWRYTVSPLGSANDSWEMLAARPPSGINANGAAAYDPVRNIYIRPGAKENTILFWDLNRESEGVFKGETVMLDPNVGKTFKFGTYGMDYDPVLDKIILWNGEDNIIRIDLEDLISVDQTNLANIRGFFQIEDIVPPGMDNPFDKVTGKFTGVYGKWHYMKDKNAYIGVIDPIAGDVYIYKSNDSASPDGNDQ